MPMAMIALTMPAPNTAVIMMADRIAGKAKVKSDSRMMSSSTQPRGRQQAQRPCPTRPMPTRSRPPGMELRAPPAAATRCRARTRRCPASAGGGACSLLGCSSRRGDQASTRRRTAQPWRRPPAAARARRRSTKRAIRPPREVTASSGRGAPRRRHGRMRGHVAGLHARIDHGIEHVDDEVDHHHHRRQQHHAVAHHDQVAVGDGLEDQPAQPGR